MRTLILYCLAGTLLPALLFSCKTQNLFQQSSPKGSADSSFFTDSDGYQYTFRRDDKLSISVWDNEDLSVGSVYGIYNSAEGYGKWLMVDANGEIALPRIGNIRVEGLTLVELKQKMITELARTIKKPVVDIKVLNREVTVLGEVKSPGKVHLEKENNTLVEVIGQAGDFDLYGNRAAVQVIRKSHSRTADIILDLTRMDQLARNNITLHPGDIVYVPARKQKSWEKSAGSTIIPAASAVTALLLIFKTFF